MDSENLNWLPLLLKSCPQFWLLVKFKITAENPESEHFVLYSSSVSKPYNWSCNSYCELSSDNELIFCYRCPPTVLTALDSDCKLSCRSLSEYSKERSSWFDWHFTQWTIKPSWNNLSSISDHTVWLNVRKYDLIILSKTYIRKCQSKFWPILISNLHQRYKIQYYILTDCFSAFSYSRNGKLRNSKIENTKKLETGSRFHK